MNEEKNENPGQTKKCPKCSELIQKSASKCKHCGSDLRHWFIRHKILSAILILFVIVIIGGSGSDKQSGQQTNNAGLNNPVGGQTKNESPVKTYKIGNTASVGYFSYVVAKTENKDSVGNEYVNKKADGVYKIVYLGLRNNDKEFRYADSNMFKLVDDQNRSFVTSSEGTSTFSMANGGNLDFFLKQANPGVQINGALVFDIPKDAKGLKLEVSGSFGSSEKAYIALE